YLPAIISMIETLIEKGYAYVAPNGDVMYAVAKFDGYGKMSGKRLADRRAGVGLAVGQWTARLAHRVLRHVGGAARLSFRHPRRRPRPQVSAPRERDRADLRGHRRPLRRDLDAQRLPQHRQREDVEVAGQLLHGARGARQGGAAPRRAALFHALEPLPGADQLFARAARAGGCGARADHDGSA